ncbi:beta-lactamase family protein [Nocardia sp. NBC_00565]|uniref:serine hydrolase domain-containing protein n=1 Tax=Nocardia sp. NBC_00565 TaxID=2975993 RepID=UPI002E821E47|nr:serine hydrolase domain-containing protein [Nocardia sp. NBC_00565]WUC01068.1 beta-lactamase family protein [Nocardia sp. NBC_00565]
MSDVALVEFVETTASKFGIPGAAVGVWVDGREVFATHGVTSVANPVPVDRDTMFVLGSVSKSFTATALMRLVAEGKVELDAPVRRYVPELVLADERAAAEMTVLNLLNHTAGLGIRLIIETGDGDDALAQYVARLPELEQIAPVGARASYSQAGYNLLGRVIEKVTGLTFEKAVAQLVLDPIGLSHSRYAPAEVMTHRFAVGHNLGEDGTLAVAREWKDTRANNPGGGIASSVADQLRWARFHLGDGRTESGARVLPTGMLDRMKEQTVELQGSSLGDAFGICWFLRDVDGVRFVGHGGSSNGQFAELLTVPERNFAITVMSNAGPDDGIQFNQAVVRWALEHYLGVIDRDPEPLPFDAARAEEIVGDYEIDVMTLIIGTDDAGLTVACGIKPEVRAASEIELPPDLPAAGLGLLPDDQYIVISGGLQGQRGFFTRDERGKIVGADLAGRMFGRVQQA